MFSEQRERVKRKRRKSVEGFSLQKNRKVLKEHIHGFLNCCFLFVCFLRLFFDWLVWGFVFGGLFVCFVGVLFVCFLHGGLCFRRVLCQ